MTSLLVLALLLAPIAPAQGCTLSVVVFVDVDGDGEYGLADAPLPGAQVRFDGMDYDITRTTNDDGATSIAAKCNSSWRVSYPHGKTTLTAGSAAVAATLPVMPSHTFLMEVMR